MTETADVPEEVEQPRVESGEVRDEVEPAKKQRRRRGRLRRVIAVLLVVLASITVPLATTAVWARQTVVDTNEFVDTVGPLIRERQVQIALGDYLTAQIMNAVDVEQLFSEALPDRGQVLAAPLASAVEGFVHDKVDEIVSSERFAELWNAAVERAQKGALVVLRGEGREGTALNVEDGEVVLNLIPAINAILGAINDTSPEVLGREVTLPEITATELPDAARARLEEALGRPLPKDFGNIKVFQSDTLVSVQDSVHIVQRGFVVLLLVAATSIVGALAVSRSRRRTLLQLVLGIGLGLVLLRRLGLRSQIELLALVKIETNREAIDVVSDRVLSGLLDITQSMLIGLLAIAVIALLTGPYRWAVALRRGVVALARATVGAAGQVGGNATVEWAETHKTALQVAALVAGGLIVLLFDLSWFWLLVVITLIGAVELWLSRLPEPSVEANDPG